MKVTATVVSRRGGGIPAKVGEYDRGREKGEMHKEKETEGSYSENGI
jgi:hypothetical protein